MPPDPAGFILRAHKLSKTYRMGEVEVPALCAIDFEVAPGEFVALVGSSGSGKSTLLNLIGCLDRPSSGQLWIDGVEIAGMGREERADLRRDKIGFVFQSFNLLSRTSALENVEMPLLYARDCGDAERVGRAREALKRVGLADRMDHFPAQLSGGQQQRVAIARALVTRPRLILADEPTGNLDSRMGGEILGLLEELNREGTTLVMVTHDPTLADRVGRKVTLKDGTIVEDVRRSA